MQRIEPVTEAGAPPKTAELLAAVKKQMGGVPNILATLARSPAGLGGYLGLAQALGTGRLPAGLREQVALAVAGANGCSYCASAHTALGKGLGLSAGEMEQNLTGRSGDPKVEAALRFVRRVLDTKGHVSDADLAAVRKAGLDDEEIVELIANTALNVFTNYFNHVAGTEIDFPVVEIDRAAAA